MSATLSLVAAFPASERSSSCSPSLENDHQCSVKTKIKPVHDIIVVHVSMSLKCFVALTVVSKREGSKEKEE